MQNVLLIVTGGIAACKSLDLIRRLRAYRMDVHVILTRAAEEFITPLSAATLSGNPVHRDLFDPVQEAEIGHIQLSRQADLVLVAPATANTIAKLAHGLADNLATTCLLATNKPVYMAPAMNVKMWEHPATRRNIDQLHADGVRFIGPGHGPMACGETGDGRMSEPEEIAAVISVELIDDLPHLRLKGKKVLVTAGTTQEPIDPVRFLSNHSSGKQGYEIAWAAFRMGAEVHLVLGPGCIAPSPFLHTVHIQSAQEMYDAAHRLIASHQFDMAFFVAAVSDWRMKIPTTSKTKKQAGQPPPTLELAENPDILRSVARLKSRRPRLVTGFAAETDDVLENARTKLVRKGCDMIVANEINPENPVFGAERNLVHIIETGSTDSWPSLSKTDVARKLLELATGRLEQMPE